MATCKDCIHLKVCLCFHNNNLPDDVICNYFKNRSEFIELPCEVGDYVYCLNRKGQIRQFKTRCVKTNQSNIKVFELLKANPENYELTLGCDNTVGLLWLNSDKTKNVYFSKEQAEQALKERE